MAKNSVKRVKTLLDPTFSIPDGVDELVYDEIDETSLQEGLDTFVIETDEEEDGPEVPDSLTIVKQTLQRTPDGSHLVVDVIAEVEDIPGVIKYDVRIVKL